MIVRRLEVSLLQFVLAMAALFTLVYNFPFFTYAFTHFKYEGIKSVLFIASTPFLLFCYLGFIFNVLLFRWYAKPLMVLILLLSACVVYAQHQFHVVFDRSMVRNTFESNTHEALSYFNISFLSYFIVLGVLPACALYFVRIRKTSLWQMAYKKGVCAIALLIAIVIIALPLYENYASFGRNHSQITKLVNPTQFLWSLKNYAKEKYKSHFITFKKIGVDARIVRHNKQATKPTLVVFVLGETARVQNYQYAGYTRDTNKYTRAFNPIFINAHSCGTATAESVPCMFSNLGKNHFSQEKASNQSSVLDVMQMAGVNVDWIENDGGCKGVCDRVSYEGIDMKTLDADTKNKFCEGEGCHDEILVGRLERYLQKAPQHVPVFVGLHIMGSHGPTYYQRYPSDKALFTPDCNTNEITQCDRASLVNTYDNTIAYTDFVLSELMKVLERYRSTYNVSLMYISDHGESLGENGLYLHGTPYLVAPETQKRVPWLMWFGADTLRDVGIKEACLRQQSKQDSFSHDNVFHSVLGLLDVQTQVYNPQLDVFSRCRF